jgi:hypothetical protein
MNVFAQAPILLLPTTLEIPRIPMAHICALEVPPTEDSDQVLPVVDLGRWEVLQPGSGRVRQELG